MTLVKRWVFGCLSRLVDHTPSLCPLSSNHASGESRFEALERAAYHEETCRGDLEGEREDESRDPKRHPVLLLERGILVLPEGYGRSGSTTGADIDGEGGGEIPGRVGQLVQAVAGRGDTYLAKGSKSGPSRGQDEGCLEG